MIDCLHVKSPGWGIPANEFLSVTLNDKSYYPVSSPGSPITTPCEVTPSAITCTSTETDEEMARRLQDELNRG